MSKVSRSLALTVIAALGLIPLGASDVRAAGEVVNVVVTTPDQGKLLQTQPPVAFDTDSGSDPITVDIDEAVRHQTMDGFGSSLTDSSAWLIANKMSATQRAALLSNLFTTSGSGIGLSILRQPMGASDFALSNYNYDNTCCDLSDFSIGYEMSYVVPVLKQIQALSPQVLIMGTPWSAPGWMKSSGTMKGGTLQPAYYNTYAQYFVKWVQAYQAQGLPIWAVTPQNEPMHDTTSYPSMGMVATDQASFIKNDLGPAFASAGLSTKIIDFDHNWSIVSYPTTVLNDPAAKAFIAGTGFHCYGGNMSAQTTLHNAHPDRDIWHTECSDGTWIGGGTFAALFDRNMREMTIGVTRNWSKGTIKWNLALDTANGPTNGGCPTCKGTVTIDQATGNVTYNSEYYATGHASKFVRRGAYRIASNTFAGGIENVAFLNPDGGKVLVAYNSGTAAAGFKVRWSGQSFTYTLPSHAAATFTWRTAATPTPTPTLTPTPTPTPTSTPTPTPTPTPRPTAPATYVEITPGASAVTASTSDTNVPANAVDNALATRWSGNGSGAWLQLDLGAVRTVGHVTVAVYQGNLRRNTFDLQLSNDGNAWTTVFSGQSGGTTTLDETYDFVDRSARYVRYVGQGATLNAGGTTPWNSVAEVSVFALSASPVEVTPGASAVTASTNDGNVPANAVDNTLATRWSANGDGQWIQFDLGTTRLVTSARIAAYNGDMRQSRFDLQVSTTGTAWTTVWSGSSSGTTTAEETYDFADVSARYVRYLGHGNSVNAWNSLTEASLFAAP